MNFIDIWLVIHAHVHPWLHVHVVREATYILPSKLMYAGLLSIQYSLANGKVFSSIRFPSSSTYILYNDIMRRRHIELYVATVPIKIY